MSLSSLPGLSMPKLAQAPTSPEAMQGKLGRMLMHTVTLNSLFTASLPGLPLAEPKHACLTDSWSGLERYFLNLPTAMSKVCSNLIGLVRPYWSVHNWRSSGRGHSNAAADLR